ncbi:MAG TPA: hypothetical protein VJB65_02320 [Patescibacteria group bacterium]|nr:hypothetical protein [Patescibacteria group bacterium]
METNATRKPREAESITEVSLEMQSMMDEQKKGLEGIAETGGEHTKFMGSFFNATHTAAVEAAMSADGQPQAPNPEILV